MKKLITIAVIFVLTSLMIGCKSSSVMKRRYTKGYYVHHAAKHSEPKVNDKITAVKHLQPVSPVTTEKVESSVAEHPAKKPVVLTATAEQLAKKASTRSEVAKQKDVKAFGSRSDLKVLPTAFSVKKQFKLVDALIKKAKSGDAAGEALSLLWIVIVILLIIYLLGFAFDSYGIGPLFNLLALIIVILLILWLLRLL